MIRGNKSDIDLLDKEWPNVALQTGWKLEPVLCFESTEFQPALNTVLNCDDSPTSTPTTALQPLHKSSISTNSPTVTISQDGTSPVHTNTSQN